MHIDQVESMLQARWRRYPLIGLVTWPFDDHTEGIAELREEFRRSHSPWCFWPRSFLRWMINELHSEDGLANEGVYAFLDERLAEGYARRAQFSITGQQKEIHEHFRARRGELFVCDTSVWEGPYYFVDLLKFHSVSPAGLAAQLRSVLPSLKAHPDFALLAKGSLATESDDFRLAEILERVSRDLGPETWSRAPLAERLMRIASARPLLARAIRHLLAADAAECEVESDLFGHDAPVLSWLVREREWSEDGPTLRLPPLREGCTWWLGGEQVTGPEIDRLAPENTLCVEVRERERVAGRYFLQISPRAHSLESMSDADLERLLPGEHLFLYRTCLSKNGRAMDAEPVLAASWADRGFKSARIEIDAGDRIQIDGNAFEIPCNFLRPPQPTASSIMSEFDPPLVTQWPIQCDNFPDATIGLDMEFDNVGPDQRPQTGVPFRLRWRRRGRPVSDWAGPFVFAEGACMSRPSFRAAGVPWTRWLRIPEALRAEAPGSKSLEPRGSGWWLVCSSQESQVVRVLGSAGSVASAKLGAPLVKWRLATREAPAPEWQTDPLLYDPECPWGLGTIDVFFDHQSIQCEFLADSFPFKQLSNREGFIRLGLDRLREFGVGSGEARSLFIRNKDVCLLVAGPAQREEPRPLPQSNERPPDEEPLSLTWMPRVRCGRLLLPGEHRETVQVSAGGRDGTLRLVGEVSGERFASVGARVDPFSFHQDIALTLDLPDATAESREVSMYFEFVPLAGEPLVLHPCGEPFLAELADLQGWLKALLAEDADVSPLANRMRLFRSLSAAGCGQERQHAVCRWHERSVLPREHLVALLGLGGFPMAAWRLGKRALSDAGPEDELDAFWIIHDALHNELKAARWGPISGDWRSRPGLSLSREIVRAVDSAEGAAVALNGLSLLVSQAETEGGISASLAGLARLIRGWVGIAGSRRLLPMDWNSAADEWAAISADSLPADWAPGLEFLRWVAATVAGEEPAESGSWTEAQASDFVRCLVNMPGLRRLGAWQATPDAVIVLRLFSGQSDETAACTAPSFWTKTAEWLIAKAAHGEAEAAARLREAKTCARGNLLHESHLAKLSGRS